MSRELPTSLSLSLLLYFSIVGSTFEVEIGVFRVRFCQSVVHESRRAYSDLRNGDLGSMIG
ncbi:unnamed protein product [Camellia sinensis]